MRRVQLAASAAAPLIISAAGVDAAAAGFVDQIFNGNCPSLRSLISGSASIANKNPFSASADTANTVPVPLPFTLAHEPLAFSLCELAGGYFQAPYNRSYTIDYTGDGGTGIACSKTTAYPLNFSYMASVVVHYAVLRNPGRV